MDEFINSLKSAMEKCDHIMFTSADMTVQSQNSRMQHAVCSKVNCTVKKIPSFLRHMRPSKLYILRKRIHITKIIASVILLKHHFQRDKKEKHISPKQYMKAIYIKTAKPDEHGSFSGYA